MDCPICQNRTRYFCEEGDFKIYKCTNCGLGVTLNSNLQESDYHRDDTYIKEETLFKNIFERRFNIISKLIKPGKVLEVGCSTGLFLSLLKKGGWEVTGVEISKKAAQVAKARGLKVITNSFDQIKFSEKFDLIIFNHTLEHLKSPQNVIKKSYSILKNGGLLYIDLPNFDSLSAKLLKDKWSLLLPAEHLWHFTEKSLELMLKKLNFKIIFSNKSSGVWDYAHPLLGILQSFFSFKKRFFKESLTLIPSLVVSKLGLGSDLMVIVKKI